MKHLLLTFNHEGYKYAKKLCTILVNQSIVLLLLIDAILFSTLKAIILNRIFNNHILIIVKYYGDNLSYFDIIHTYYKTVI